MVAYYSGDLSWGMKALKYLIKLLKDSILSQSKYKKCPTSASVDCCDLL